MTRPAPQPLLPPVIDTDPIVPADIPVPQSSTSGQIWWIRVPLDGGTYAVALPDPLPPVADGWTRTFDPDTGNFTDTEDGTS